MTTASTSAIVVSRTHIPSVDVHGWETDGERYSTYVRAKWLLCVVIGDDEYHTLSVTPHQWAKYEEGSKIQVRPGLYQFTLTESPKSPNYANV